ncbi:MAG: HNH endonuclease [Planctomycetes bacterium]|nr:HNH endonuclease [Planctomycetota bacterium]
MSTARHLTAADFPTHTKGRCRVCQSPVPKGRRTFCGKACVLRMRMLCFTGEQVRRVDRRDRGICAMCGWNMKRLARIVGWAMHWEGLRKRPCSTFPSRRTSRFIQPLVNSLGRWLWQVDHIVPVCEGGGIRPDMMIDEVLANLRTLCTACHHKETKLAGRAAASPAEPGKKEPRAAHEWRNPRMHARSPVRVRPRATERGRGHARHLSRAVLDIS